MRHWKTGVGVVAALAASAGAISAIRNNGAMMGVLHGRRRLRPRSSCRFRWCRS